MAKAKVAAAGAGGVDVAGSRTDVPGAAVPRAAPINPARA